MLVSREELEVNPALEEGRDKEEKTIEEDTSDVDDQKDDDMDDLSIDDYLQEEEINGYKMYGDGNVKEEEREMPLPMTSTLNDNLMTQLGFLGLPEKEKTIAITTHW